MFNLKNCKEPISQIQIVGHSTNNLSVFFQKFEVLKNQVKGQEVISH